MDYLLVVVGLLGLILGGEGLVRGAVAIAARYKVSPLVIGVTLVGFGTSMPELVTSLQAALSGSPGIAVGNVVGSNIANILLILGCAALLAPIVVKANEFRRDGVVLMGATLLCLGAVQLGEVGRVIGGCFVVLLLGYLVFTLMKGEAGEEPEVAPMPITHAILFMVGGLAVTIFAARLMVGGAVGIAEALGVSEAVIGLTIVAIGTSMPEFITSVIAARKGQVALAFGNVVGSNIFNILGILGITVLVKPLVVPPQIMGFDIWVMLAATVALCVFAVSGWRLTRTEGAFLVGGYGAYLTYLVATL